MSEKHLKLTNRWFDLRLVALICIFLILGRAHTGLAEAADPREFGFDLPAGEVTAGNGLTVAVADSGGNQVVGKTLVNVGQHRLVLLPDGELVARSVEESPPAVGKFVPLSTDDLMSKLAAGPLRQFGLKARKTRHYVYLYSTSEAFAEAASRILESMIPGMLGHARQQKIEAHEPEVPLVAIMFRTREEFDAFRPMPGGVAAYYHTLSNQVVMYEESPLWRVKPELALQQTISTIAHEGAHQILHNIGVQQRLSMWPMWLSEGLAEYYAPTSFTKKLRWKGAGQVNDMRMFELELYLKGRSAEAPDGQMIEHAVSAARLTSTGYAAAWSLTHFLATHEKEKFHQYIRRTSKIGPLDGNANVVAPGIIPDNLKLFRETFGEDLSGMEGRLVKHLKSLDYSDPFGEWPHFVAMVEVPSGRRSRREANLFHSPEMARKWVSETVAALPEGQQTQARRTIEEFPNRRIAEGFARQFLGSAR
jgi:hypothetical protein